MDEVRADEVQKSAEEDSYKKLVNIAVIIMLVALIFIAVFTFFFSMQSAISALFDYRYAELGKAIFSLVVIGVGVYLVKIFMSK